jgi:NADPH-dependent 2,4-dienoyl-CoA reductase/sulfur reductase-like enzyme
VREGVRPGRRALIVETADGAGMAESVASLLAAAGTRVVARCSPADIRAIHGRSSVRAVTHAGGRVRCDLVVIAAGGRPADELERQADIPQEPHVG